MISSSFLAAITITVASIFNLYMEVLHINYRYEVWHDANPEKTIENCTLMLQHIMDDSTIPRNIRAWRTKPGSC